MNSYLGTCRIGDDEEDRPCEVVLNDSPGSESWHLDTCVTWEESNTLMDRSQPVDVEIHLKSKTFHGQVVLKNVHAIPEGERSTYYPFGADMLGSGPLKPEE